MAHELNLFDWEFIDGYEDYMVSRRGDVVSFKSGKIKFLKFHLVKGYCRVGLSKKGISKNFLIHRLIAISFIPNFHNKPEVDHISRIPLDNRVENLVVFSNSSHSKELWKLRRAMQQKIRELEQELKKIKGKE